MLRLFSVSLLVLAVITTAFLPSLASPASAADLTCVADPSSGPPGTTFGLTASGFSPNTMVWLYAVEPDGTAFSDPTFNAFGGGAKANADGVVSFTFVSRFSVYDIPIARALGDWTLVVQELGLGGSTVHQAECKVNIAAGTPAQLTGAALAVNPAVAVVGTDVVVTGSGFEANEPVNLWVSPPQGCSSWAFELPNVPPYHYSAASAYGQDSIKTTSEGEFIYFLPTYSLLTCHGEWTISAFAPRSGFGATATYTIVGRATPGGAVLTVNPEVAVARGALLTFSGSGYTPNGVASCWETRPEGTVRFIDSVPSNGGGEIGFNLITGMDDAALEMHYSEGSAGQYAMTCRDNATGVTGEAQYLLSGLPVDP
ncbi:MAG: hypothetical protein ACM3JD_10660 [Rudaea sp.]